MRAVATLTNFGETCDRLTEALDDAEEALASLHAGVVVEVPMGDRLLRFGRDGGEWRLQVVSEETIVPLVKASLALRIEAADHLAALLTALEGKQGQIAKQIEQATLRARSFAAHVRGLAPATNGEGVP